MAYSIKGVALSPKHSIFNAIAKAKGRQQLSPAEMTQVSAHLVHLPPQAFSASGRIVETFAQPVIELIGQAVPEGLSADELFGIFKRENLLEPLGDPADVCSALAKTHQTALKNIDELRRLRDLNDRLLQLQDQVQNLGSNPVKNRKVASTCICKALGFSGVRVYTVDLEDGSWEHVYSEGEEGDSRFNKPAVPEIKSEKGYINDNILPLLGTVTENEQQFHKLSVKDNWGYFYIKDRSKCDFVDLGQLLKDEEGDPKQNRNGYGFGSARQILYLFFGEEHSQKKEIYLITNWAANKPLFRDVNEDLNLIEAFAKSLARENRSQARAVIDDLTQTYNRRYFNEKITDEYDRASRYQDFFSLAILDVDDFKGINDKHGHQAGDQILKAVAQMLKKLVRKNDTLARYGGEEFAVIIIKLVNGRLFDAGERYRRAIENMEVEITSNEGEKSRVKVTVSVGVAACKDTVKIGSVEDLISRADAALYKAKHRGKNCTVVDVPD